MHVGDFSLQAGLVIELVVFSDASTVLANLRALGIFLGGDNAKFFTKRQVNIGFCVAGCTGVSIPVPGAAKVASLFNNPQVLEARFPKPSAGNQSAETTPDNDDLGFVGERFAWGCRFDIGIFDVIGKVVGHFNVLVVTIAAQSLVTFETIPVSQLVGIKAKFFFRWDRLSHGRVILGMAFRFGNERVTLPELNFQKY